MPSLQDTLTYTPNELKFGTSGLRGLVTDMTDLECYINTFGFLRFLQNSGMAEKPVVALAGDLRSSTPRILAAVARGIIDAGFTVSYQGFVPTPALAYYASLHGMPCIMVSGSHIPDDRNGIKFYRPDGEVLKADEMPIKQAVAEVRSEVLQRPAETSGFDTQGMLRMPQMLPVADPAARETYIQRYVQAFGAQALAGKQVVLYQQSAVGRDIVAEILAGVGAQVIAVGRSEVFIPIDSDNVTPKDEAYFAQLAAEHPGAFAVVATDGDGDRPLVADETGRFYYGDLLGTVVATWCKADFAAIVAIASDAVDTELRRQNIPFERGRVGSPYVISLMQQAQAAGKQRVVGWELNGGFLLGTELQLAQGSLKPLLTRDAVLPLLACLALAAERQIPVSRLFADLPQRYTATGLIDNFPTEVSKQILEYFSNDTPQARTELAAFFTAQNGFGAIVNINTVDGIRIAFDNGDIAHIRPSGNAPQLRTYSVASTKQRADEIVALAISDSGILRALEQKIMTK